MKNRFEKPELEIVIFVATDIIVTSSFGDEDQGPTDVFPKTINEWN